MSPRAHGLVSVADVFLGFSPDPVLTGVMFAESIKGIQSQAVQASAK